MTSLADRAVQARPVVPPRRETSFRPDIQGLRAIAVVAVILDHALHWPSGGFVGVDVFFVISGFLITGLLLREHDRTGTIPLKGFYARRVRRILPAALATIVATVVATVVVYGANGSGSIFSDALFAAISFANWHFAADGTNYFQASSAPSPLQHFWSLSVEEQFYLVWPWLLLAIFAAAVVLRSTRLRMVGPLVVLGALTAGSFAIAMVQSANEPSVAYFSTFSRAWELGVGSLLALAARPLARLPRIACRLLGWGGLLAIVISCFVINDQVSFPAPWALLPVLGASAVIVSGLGPHRPRLVALTNPVAVYVGEISYSLYLWHFPVIILVADLIPTTSVFSPVVTGTLIVACALLSYYCIERPFRQAGRAAALQPIPGRRPSPSRQQRSRQLLELRNGLIAAATAVVVAMFGIFAWQISNAQASAGQDPVASVQPDEQHSLAATQSAAEYANTKALQAALGAKQWPQLDPAIGSAGFGPVSEWTRDGCLNVTATNVDRCVYGRTDSLKLLAVVGDSTAISYLPALEDAVGRTYRIQVLTMQECPMADVQVAAVGAAGAGTPYTACTAHRAWVEQWVRTNRPGLIVMTDSSITMTRMLNVSGNWGRESAVQTGTRTSVSALTKTGARVVVLASPPIGDKLQSCKTNFSPPSACVSSISSSDSAFLAGEQAGVAAATGSATFVQTSAWFCVANQCPAFVSTVPQFADGEHLTGGASRRLGPLVREAIG